MRPGPASSLPRFEGPIAYLAHLAAVLEDAVASGDTAREREASESLARALSSRGIELHLAVKLARRALALEDDPILRSDVAGWLAGLGDPGTAALELRAGAEVAPGTTRARTLTRVAVLLARANKPDSALLVLEEAAEADPSDPMPSELIGLLSSLAPEVVSADRGVRGYVDAAARRRDAGDEEAALEDLLRAFELDPSSVEAVDAVSSTLQGRGRVSAADELVREHALVLAELGRAADAARTHARRVSGALARHDAATAASVAIDLGLAESDSEVASKVDEALGRAGLWELVAARLELRARTGPDQAGAWAALARLHEGALPNADRATHALIGLLSADPTARSAVDALREHASRTGDHRSLAEGLLAALLRARSLGASPGAEPVWLDLARELADVAEGGLDDPRLAAWIYAELARASDADREQAEFGRIRLEARIAERSAELARAEALLDASGVEPSSDPRAASAGGVRDSAREARLANLRKLERLYGLSPDLADRSFAVLASIVRADPLDERAARSLDLAHARDPQADLRADLHESVVRARLEAPVSARERARLRSALAGVAFHGGAVDRALEEVAPLLEQPDMDAFGAAAVALFAAAAGSPRELARALSQLARSVSGPVAAIVHAAASESWHRAGAVAEARNAAEDALLADPGCARAASALARAASSLGGREGAVVLERALGVAVTRAWLCDALARCLESIGEVALAFAWTQRWLALTPGDPRAIAELVRRCQVGADSRRIADALAWVLASPAPPPPPASFLEALAALFSLERTKGGQLARRTLDVLGPRDETVRNRLLVLADEHGDEPLSIALLERHVATLPEPPAELYLDLAQRRLRAKDYGGAAREVLRAALVGGDPRAVLDLVDEVERRDAVDSILGSDGFVALAEARARGLSALLTEDEQPSSEAKAHVAQAWRSVAGARWDLARDPRGAEQALFTAAEQEVDRGFEQYARDLFELAAPDQAIGAIFERLIIEEDEPRHVRVALCLAAAQLATDHGLASWALDAACRVLALEPCHPEAIAIAEMHASQVDRGAEAIDGIYTALATSAMGAYGRRAAHYRAARQLEALGAPSRALSHALSAIEAVPNEGTIFDLLHRLVDPERGSSEAVTLLERLGDRGPREERAAWTRRAIDFCGSDREGLVRRLDVSIRGLSASPEARLVAAVEDALAKLAADGGIPEGVPAQLEDVARRALPHLEGPDGARTAALLARAFVACDAPVPAIEALERAARVDGDVEIYDQLLPMAEAFAAVPEEATGFARGVLERTKSKHELVGPPLIRLAATIADNVADGATSEALYAELELREAAEKEQAGAPAPTHEDPFADPAMFDSLPPADAAPAPDPDVSVISASPETIETVGAALGEAAALSAAAGLEQESEAETTPDVEVAPREELPPPAEAASPRAPEVEAILAEVLSVPPPAVSPVPSPPPPSVRSVAPRDGFAALFDEDDDGGPSSMEDAELARREAEARDRGDHEAVSELLHRRIISSSWTEQVRVLKLRRAVVLDERLSRRDDAKRELEEILVANPEDRSALALLADLHAKGEAPARAAALWERLAEAPGLTEEERVDYSLRAARSFLHAEDAAAALRVTDRIGGAFLDDEALAIRVDALRALGEKRGLIDAIDRLVAGGRLGNEACAELLVEAARASVSLGDEASGLSHARRALRYAPDSPDAALECARLEYRTRGMGTPREAQAVVEALGAIADRLEPASVALHTFLLAEALDVIQGGGAGMRELSKRHAEIGPEPLLALGMAERLARSRSFGSAVPLFERALAGDLLGLRSKGRVALAGADAALQGDDLPAAERFLTLAEAFPELTPHVERRKRELVALAGETAEARPILEELARSTNGIAKARFLHRLGQLTVKDDLPGAIDLYEEAIRASRRDRPFAEKIRNELIALLDVHGPISGVEVDEIPPPSSSAAEPAEEPPPSYAVPTPPVPSSDPATDRPAVLDLGSASMTEPSSIGASRAPSAEAQLEIVGDEDVEDDADDVEDDADDVEDVTEEQVLTVAPLGSLAPPVRPNFADPEEERLFEELVLRGHVHSGLELAASLEEDESRTRDLLVVRRHLAALQPGHRPTIEALRDAALAERDEVYARSLEHVLRISAKTRVTPPPLAAQPREPELVQNLLLRGVSSRETEVLALVWESGMYRRDLASYGLSGADRVPLTLQSVLGEIYSELAAHLGAPRALFHKRGKGPVSVGIALLSQPALVVTGDVTERSTDLAYALAAAHVTATQELVLAASLPDAQLKRLLDGVAAAFGPVRPPSDDAPTSSSDAFRADVARIAAELWQRVGPRADRQLRELAEAGPFDLGVARATARRAMRRAGLFASGELGTALRFAALETGVDEAILQDPDGLEALCNGQPEAADIVRLATSLEYAEARWQAPPPTSLRR
ncbi:MAG: hypothetical protein JNL21_11075 [Myxococcales bacterium]|nr:hypothetical protein [Myxococcales bacterium]